MKYLVFGSLNIDRTYSVDHFVRPCETLSAAKMELFCGGKGFNQAIALSRAGRDVYFAGAVGEDGELLLDALKTSHIHLDYLLRVPGPSGHSIIQVDPSGQNCILILGGANFAITPDYIDSVLENFGAGDLIVLQNEIPHVDCIIRRAKERSMTVAFNPSPYNARVEECDLRLVDYLLVNEVEGRSLTGLEAPEDILLSLHKRCPCTNIVLTLGSQGSEYMGRDGKRISCGIYQTPVLDTTGAGDTFTGYFLSEITCQRGEKEALETAAIASGISVSRPGASASVPYSNEVVEVKGLSKLKATRKGVSVL